MDLDKISTLIKTKRKEQNLTQKELADKINVTEKAISRWETKRGTPDISLLIPLADALDINVSDLLNGKVNKNENKNIKEIINYIEINKKNKNKIILPLVVILYGVLLFLYLGFLKLDYGNFFSNTFIGEMLINTFFAFCVIIINYLLGKYYFDLVSDKEKINKITYIILLVIYCITFLNVTIFGRSKYGVIGYNIVPFKTLIQYVKYFTWHDFKINIIGNIVILMPLEIIIVKLFKIKKFSLNLLINFILVTAVELLQYITRTGIFDIDDIILNVFGMMLIFCALKGKKNFFISLTIFLSFLFLIFGSSKIINYYQIHQKGIVTNVLIDLKPSSSHRKDDLNYIVSNIIRNFNTKDYKGCQLIKIEYNEEEIRKREIGLAQEENYDEVIIMTFKFKTNNNPLECFDPNQTYEHQAIYGIKNERIVLLNVGMG